jgi:TolA-binding protein
VSWGAHAVETFATQPRAPWQADDPADSLYRAAREQLNRGDYRAAAKSFALIVERYPKSTYAGDAMYWQAYEQSSVRPPLRGSYGAAPESST